MKTLAFASFLAARLCQQEAAPGNRQLGTEAPSTTSALGVYNSSVFSIDWRSPKLSRAASIAEQERGQKDEKKK